MKCNFVVGQKVVCIASDGGMEGFEVLSTYDQPIVGKIYTIRDVKIGAIQNRVGLKFVEINDQRVFVRNGIVSGSVSILWEPTNFRPLNQRPTDISIFKAMLTPKNEQVPA